MLTFNLNFQDTFLNFQLHSLNVQLVILYFQDKDRFLVESIRLSYDSALMINQTFSDQLFKTNL